jgi:multidrug efflux pump subunit AcrB
MEEIEAVLAEYPELYNIGDNLEKGTPELQIRVNTDEAARYGLNTALIGSYIRSSFDGIKATTIFKENEEIDVLVKYADTADLSMNSFMQLKIPTLDGRQIPFSSVARIEENDPIASIKRVDGKREVTIFADALNTDNVRAINGQITQIFESRFAPIYPGIELKVGGEFAEFDTLLQDILQIFLVGVFLIYIILGTQFKSYIQPALIIFTIPFSFAGVILFLVISGTPFSTTVLYAGVALAGIAVNDSIVLISFINDLKKKGYDSAHAVIEAAVTRLRPIILTSLTTIAGLIPTALGLGGKSVVWGPMASTIIFGLIFSTFTALVIIPCIYGILDEGRTKRMRKKLAVKPGAEVTA